MSPNSQGSKSNRSIASKIELKPIDISTISDAQQSTVQIETIKPSNIKSKFNELVWSLPSDLDLTLQASNSLHDLGMKIFYDRYALKDTKKETLDVGDTVVVCVDVNTGQREIGNITAISNGKIEVELNDGQLSSYEREHVDKPIETTPNAMMDRVAKGISQAEISNQLKKYWGERFRWLLDDWKFIPAGRILAAAGSDQALTYYNCYVIPSPKDSRGGIIDTLEQMNEIFSRGGGVGINLSSLRPRYAFVKGVNGRSSGAVSWGSLYSFSTGLIEQGGSRRGALMLILNIWHPDVEEFIRSKREMGKITNANISVGITDDFMAAVENDGNWDLKFPDNTDPDYDQLWDGNLDSWVKAGKKVNIYKTVKAKDLWHQIIESAWTSAEPGIFFIERSNKMSNSWYFSPLICTNPCGEQPLPAWAVCNLGAINLSKFVSTNSSDVEWEKLGTCIKYAVRFLDNVIDSTPYFFEENKNQQMLERRVGLNTMGLAEMMIRLKIRYGSEKGTAFIDKLYEFIARNSYEASAELAREKGSFPAFEADKFLQSGYMQAMPDDIRGLVATKGMRNVTILTQAPNGTIGTMAGTSTGIEPFYFWSYNRKSRLGVHEERVQVLEEWRQSHPGEELLPDYFVTAMDLKPIEHVNVQAAIQRWIDSALSKTCNTPNSYTIEETKALYEYMYKMGCKGGTIYRDGSRDEQVLNLKPEDVKSEPVDSTPVRNYPRIRKGVTLTQKTAVGSVHVTMNDDEEGLPLEIFAEIGKGGSDVKAMSEALGRLASLVLRLQSPLSPLSRVTEIINQLKGIGGSSSIGFGKNRILSLPDAVAKALQERYQLADIPEDGYNFHQPENNSGSAESSNQNQNIQEGDTSTLGELCPACGHMTLLRIEGCSSCRDCGYSACG